MCKILPKANCVADTYNVLEQGGNKLIEPWNLKFIRERLGCFVVIIENRESLCVAVRLRAESWWLE